MDKKLTDSIKKLFAESNHVFVDASGKCSSKKEDVKEPYLKLGKHIHDGMMNPETAKEFLESIENSLKKLKPNNAIDGEDSTTKKNEE